MPFVAAHGGLTCDGLPLEDLAAEFGTPLHVYSAAAIESRYRQLDAAFAGVPHELHYAMKANATIAVLRHLRALGAGVDCNSGGEIETALRAGFAPAAITMTGVGKTLDEIDRAVALGVAAINVESRGELGRADATSGARGVETRVALRLNPDVHAGTHPNIATGLAVTKFGMAWDPARAILTHVHTWPHLRVVGLHVHVGSQITGVDPFARAAAAAADLAGEAAAHGVPLEYLDLGGGLGIPYQSGQTVISEDQYAAALKPAVTRTGLRLVLEPGRWIVGPAGVLVTTVVDVKPRPGVGRFVVVDAGMTDLLRPALYDAWHEIVPVTPREGATVPTEIVGPVCETADTLGSHRALPPIEVGDRLVIRDTGAYGSVMASNYNRRPSAAEVMVEHGRAVLARRRQTIEDLLQWDV